MSLCRKQTKKISRDCPRKYKKTCQTCSQIQKPLAAPRESRIHEIPQHFICAVNVAGPPVPPQNGEVMQPRGSLVAGGAATIYIDFHSNPGPLNVVWYLGELFSNFFCFSTVPLLICCYNTHISSYDVLVNLCFHYQSYCISFHVFLVLLHSNAHLVSNGYL